MSNSASYEERAIEELKKAGLRITMPRIQVIRALANSRRALRAQDVHQKVTEDGGRMDLVSVYRTLSTLAETGLAHHIGIVDGYLACTLESPHDESVEHAICQRCGSVTEVEMPADLHSAVLKGLSQRGFSSSEVKIEVKGICSACQ